MQDGSDDRERACLCAEEQTIVGDCSSFVIIPKADLVSYYAGRVLVTKLIVAIAVIYVVSYLISEGTLP